MSATWRLVLRGYSCVTTYCIVQYILYIHTSTVICVCLVAYLAGGLRGRDFGVVGDQESTTDDRTCLSILFRTMYVCMYVHTYTQCLYIQVHTCFFP